MYALTYNSRFLACGVNDIGWSMPSYLLHLNICFCIRCFDDLDRSKACMSVDGLLSDTAEDCPACDISPLNHSHSYAIPKTMFSEIDVNSWRRCRRRRWPPSITNLHLASAGDRDLYLGCGPSMENDRWPSRQAAEVFRCAWQRLC